MGRPVSAMAARQRAPPPAGTTAALRGVAAPPGQGEEVSLRAGQEEVSARAVQAAQDNPA
jgi:hypothetical protein